MTVPALEEFEKLQAERRVILGRLQSVSSVGTWPEFCSGERLARLAAIYSACSLANSKEFGSAQSDPLWLFKTG